MADCYTDLEKAVVVLVENFYKYVSKHSLVKNKISKSSFRKMLQKELNHMLTVSFLPGLLSPLLYPLGWGGSLLTALSFGGPRSHTRTLPEALPIGSEDSSCGPANWL